MTETSPLMRVVAAVALMGSACGNTLPHQVDSNVECVDRIPLPDYPALARLAGIQGTITASVVLSSTASVEEITTEVRPEDAIGKKLLVSLVRDAIKGSSFHSGCGNKTVQLVFRFEIVGRPSEYTITKLAYGYPNQFWITTPPALDKSKSGMK